jgi:hypothetical protein
MAIYLILTSPVIYLELDSSRSLLSIRSALVKHLTQIQAEHHWGLFSFLSICFILSLCGRC